MRPQPQQYYITEEIAELVRSATPELEERLEAQAEALQETECTDPEVGQWIDAYDVKYLLSSLALKEEEFAPRFPEMAQVTFPERQKFIATIERHFNNCVHCSLKRGYDIEIDEKIKKVCRENREILLELLENGTETLGGEDKVLEAHS